MREDTKEMLAGLLAGVVVLGAIWLLAFAVWAFGAVGCHVQYGDYKADYELLGGCGIEINGRWTPVEKVRFDIGS